MRVLFVKDESSMLRGLDSKTKLSVMLVTAVLVVACSGVISQMVLFLFTLVYVLMLKRPKLVTLLYILMAVMMAVSAGFGWLISLWAPKLGGLSAQALFVPFLRGVSMMNVVMVLALTTRVEDLLGTLERLHLPFVVFLPAVVMLRFIPTFTNDIRQVWETLRIRGWPMGPVMITTHPILSARLLFTPILFRALKSSETLGIAAELKGIGTAHRTVLPKAPPLSQLDRNIFIAMGVCVVLALLAEIFLRELFMTPGAVMP